MMTMIGTKRHVKMPRTWQRLVAVSRRRITLPIVPMAEKGHFVVYTIDSRRFVLPLEYLNSGIFRELLKMAEEEFGLPSTGRLTLPFDSALMEYLRSLIRRNVANDILEKALLTSTSNGLCLSSSSHLQQEQENPRLVIYGF